MRFGSSRSPVPSGVALATGLLLMIGATGVVSAASPPPGASPRPAVIAVPFADGYHDWMGSYHEVPGLDNAADWRIALKIGPYALALLDENDGFKLESAADMTSDGQLRLLTSTDGTECAKGDVGLYSWTLSETLRTHLSIEAGTDDCAVRAATIPGEYVTSACRIDGQWCLNELPPGAYSSALFEPRGPGGDAYKVRLGALEYRVPAGWAHADDSSGSYTLVPDAAFEAQIDDPGSWQDGIRLWSRPTALSAESMCAPKADASVGRSVDELVAWIESHPGLAVNDQQPTTIGGHDGVMLDLDIAPGWTATCTEWPDDPGPFVPLFTEGGWLKADGSGGDNAYWWGPGGFPGQMNDPERLILLDLGQGDTVAISIDSHQPADQDALVEQAMPIVETFSFPQSLSGFVGTAPADGTYSADISAEDSRGQGSSARVRRGEPGLVDVDLQPRRVHLGPERVRLGLQRDVREHRWDPGQDGHGRGDQLRVPRRHRLGPGTRWHPLAGAALGQGH